MTAPHPFFMARQIGSTVDQSAQRLVFASNPTLPPGHKPRQLTALDLFGVMNDDTAPDEVRRLAFGMLASCTESE